MHARPIAVRVAAALLVVVGVGGCVGDDPGITSLPGAEAAEGYAVDLVIDGLDGPTQLALTPSGAVVVGELAGDEDAATGRVVLIDPAAPDERTELQAGLDKPTGVAIVGSTLWIMERRSLSFASLEPGAARTVVADELPFNGRSEGSLTPTPDGGLLYDTSGRKSGAEVAEGSGSLFRIDDADPVGTGRPVPPAVVVATGFKHAYAHTFDTDGGLWATEMSDGSFDGEPASDELVAVADGDDFGWPACVGDNRPVIEFGGSPERCATAPGSHALFGPRATPIAVEVAPWDDDVLLVALWVPDQVVAVPREVAADGVPWRGDVVLAGLGNPQDLVPDGDRLLVVDYDGGRIVALSITE